MHGCTSNSSRAVAMWFGRFSDTGGKNIYTDPDSSNTVARCRYIYCGKADSGDVQGG